MLNKYDFEKLLHDLKRVSRIIHILKNEKDDKQREEIATLALDELQKLEDDIREVKGGD